ncbi:MAG: hypothetical protein IKJ45_16945 [Kiritimatiellae bacterium]|nr:hypothetical protein [Kiritimatiellia bacterium]
MKKLLVATIAASTALIALAQTQKVTVTVENEMPSLPQFVAAQAPRRVALVVQNHAARGAEIPFMALTDALAAKLSGRGFQVINPYNSYGENLNRTSQGEALPEMSAMAVARQLGADGAVTASVLEFLDSTIGTPPKVHQFSIRISLNLADAQTGAVICGETIKQKSPKYTNNQVAQNKPEYLGDLMYAAAEECAQRLEAKATAANWRPSLPPTRGNIGVLDRRGLVRGAGVDGKYVLTPSDLDEAVKALLSAMCKDVIFIDAHNAAKASSGKTPIAVNGGIMNMTGDNGYDSLVGAGDATVRVLLRDTSLFDVKDDAVAPAIAKRIITGGNSPLEDGEAMAWLKQHGSPDFCVVGDLHKFVDFEKRTTYRVHLAIHSLANGKVAWEGLLTVIK